MADTGAPWNIPYVAGTDLVSDWPTDSQALANAIASGLDAAVGKVLSIASANFTGTQTISTSPSFFTDIDDLTITVTPKSASSKFRIVAVVYATNIISNGRSAQKFQIERDGTAIEEWQTYLTASDTNSNLSGYTLAYEDAPATTSAITYTVGISQSATASATTVYVNRNEANNRSAASFLTVEEYV